MSTEPRFNSFLALGPHGFHRVAYTEWGDPRGQHIVLCVHGLTRNSRDFDELAEHLAVRGCRVVCMDVVGRGDSDWLEHKEDRSEEHTSELQSRGHLVCRLLLEKKK